ncbi:hypothetical protein NPL6_03520 [Metamycoplasma hyosynoviae]|nr:P80 family lipoprotein [Metamycoplasma hyosynoviae]KDE43539.1 hypothetical protein NPL6_03520 [Metamycoplasma hyosynoviae]
MKKNKLFTIASLTSIGAIASMSPMLISCGKKPFDQKNDGKLVISTGFSSTNSQGKALAKVIAMYNDWIGYDTKNNLWKATNKKAEGYMPVFSKANPNGYSTNEISSKLQSKDKAGFYNILVNYPSAAALLAEWKMNLAIDDADYESFGFASSFKTINDSIAFNTEKKKWVIPLGRSSEMGSVNKIVMGKILSDLKTKGATLTGTHTKIDSYISAYNSSTEKSFSEFTAKWKTKEDKDIHPNVLAKIKELKLSDELFDVYSDLIDFAILAKSIYEKNVSSYIIGIDSFPSAVNLMASSITKGDPTKNYVPFKPTDESKSIKNNGGYDFDSFRSSTNNEFKQLYKKIIEKLLDGINKKAVWIGGGGQYGSDQSKNHYMGISYGSTAGWAYTFYNDKDNVVTYKGKAPKEILEEAKVVKLNKVTEEEKLFTFDTATGGHTNSIFKSTSTKAGNFDYTSKDATADSTLSGISGGFLVTSSKLSTQDSNVIFTDDKGKTHKVENVKSLGKIFKNNDKDFYLFETSEITWEKPKQENSLQQSESDWISNPHYAFDKTKETASIFTQGPSMVLIHSNEEEDKATKLFIKWFYKHENDVKTKVNGTEVTEKKTAVEVFGQSANYITPTDKFMKNTIDDLKIKLKYNEALIIAFENFKKSIDDSANYKLVDDVPAFLSSRLRDEMGATARQAVNSPSGKTFDEFLEGVNEGLIGNN